MNRIQAQDWLSEKTKDNDSFSEIYLVKKKSWTVAYSKIQMTF